MKADLAAGKAHPFQSGGTPKSLPKNASVARNLGETTPAPPQYSASKKRPTDDQVATTKKHKPGDSSPPARTSSSVDLSWSYHYTGNICLM